MGNRATSIRLRPKALAVLDAWAALLSHERGTPRSRSDAIEAVILASKPPDQLGPEARAVREATKAMKETTR